MHIGEEVGGVLLNLPDVEALARVLAVWHDARGERAADASNAGSATVWADLRIGKGQSNVIVVSYLHVSASRTDAVLPGRPRLSSVALVNVRGGSSRRLEVTAESADGDVPADDVLVGVDAVVEGAGAAFKAARLVVLRVDDLTGRGPDVVRRSEDEGTLIAARLRSLFVSRQDLLEDRSGSGRRSGSGKGSQERDDSGQLHCGIATKTY